MGKLFEWIKAGCGKRSLQLTVLQNGKLEAIVIEGGKIIASATSNNGDGALVSVAISVMNNTGVRLPGEGMKK